MNARISLFAVAAFWADIGCVYCHFDYSQQPAEPIDLGVDADLHALIPVYATVGDRNYEHLAVGEAGTIVAWGHIYGEFTAELFSQVSTLGDVDLRAAWTTLGESQSTWWVVGDAGTIASSDNLGTTWNPIALPGISANLYGITGFENRPVIVGDDLVLVRLADGTWTQPPTPEAGWGSLRDVELSGDRLIAVGLDGAAWSTEDPLGEWQAAPVGTDADFFSVTMRWFPKNEWESVEGALLVGEAGTIIAFDQVTWRLLDPTLDVDLPDLIDAYESSILGADGNVYMLGSDDELTIIDTVEGATSIRDGFWYGITAVGVNGLAWTPAFDAC